MIFENLESLNLGNSKCSLQWVISSIVFMSESQEASKILHSCLVTYFQEILVSIARISEKAFRMNNWNKSVLLQNIDLRFSLHLNHSPIWFIVWLHQCTHTLKREGCFPLYKLAVISAELEHKEPRASEQKNLAWLDQKNNWGGIWLLSISAQERQMPGGERPIKTTATGMSCHEN